MQVDVIQFKKEEPKKGFKYTILRFPKNTRNNLIGKHAGIVDLDGAFIVLPLDKKESVITQELLNEKISKVRQSLERQIGVITKNKLKETGARRIDNQMIAGLKGFEPLAYGLRVRRSTELSYKPTS